MRAIGKADTGRSAANFLDRDHMFEIAEPQPAPFLFHGDPVQAERAHRLPQFAREAVFAVGAVGQGRDLFIGEARGGVADHLGGLAKLEVEIGGGAHFMSCGCYDCC